MNVVKIGDIVGDIKEAFRDVTGIIIEDCNKNMLHIDFEIEMIDFLYIIEILEQKGYPIIKIIENNDYTVLSVTNLSKAICDQNS